MLNWREEGRDAYYSGSLVPQGSGLGTITVLAWKRAINDALGTEPVSRVGKVVSVSLFILIVLNIVAVVSGTVEEINNISPRAFIVFEAASVAVFTVEYLLRVWACTTDAKFARPVAGRLKFIVSPLALFDLMAILPFYIALLNLPGIDLRVVRAARLVGRVARLGRYSAGIRTLAIVVQAKKDELLSVILVLLLLLLLASSLVFYAEHGAQPDKFSSIPETMWWGIITLTTVGYGDVYPVTIAGRVLAGAMAILGVGLFALPAGILGSGFIQEVQQRPERKDICPHCGEQI